MTLDQLNYAKYKATERQAWVKAVNASDTTISGDRGRYDRDLNHILATFHFTDLLGIDYKTLKLSNYDNRFDLDCTPNGKPFIVSTTEYDTGVLLKDPKNHEDLKAVYYPLVTGHYTRSFTYRGYSTHDELYSSLTDYKNMKNVYVLKQTDLHIGLPL